MGENSFVGQTAHLTTVCVLHDKAQAVMSLERVFQALQWENKKVTVKIKLSFSQLVTT